MGNSTRGFSQGRAGPGVHVRMGLCGEGAEPFPRCYFEVGSYDLLLLIISPLSLK